MKPSVLMFDAGAEELEDKSNGEPEDDEVLKGQGLFLRVIELSDDCRAPGCQQ